MTSLKELEDNIKKNLNLNDINYNNTLTEETQIMNYSENSQNIEKTVNISVKDYALILKLIINLSQRGVFTLDEYCIIGNLYKNLKNIKI